jgi:hypothetical protein
VLNPAAPICLDLTDFDSYLRCCQSLAGQRLAAYASVEEIAAHEDDINCYPHLPALDDPHDVFDLARLADSATRAWQVQNVLRGGVLWEHTSAGEATRLNLGAKYLIVPSLHLTPRNLGRDADPSRPLTIKPDQLSALSLGQRHMLQHAWNIWTLAQSAGYEPRRALANQHLLVTVNIASHAPIIDDFIKNGFFGFKRQQVFFMVQQNFPGLQLDPQRGGFTVNAQAPRRLHNHGQMVMQTLMDKQLFYLDASDNLQYLAWSDYQDLLRQKNDKVSFNIEDLDYLLDPIDIQGLAACQSLGRQGYQMVMEVVLNDPAAPIKGGACYYDSLLGRDVMIESFQLQNIKPEQITHLNKNVNHYPNPVQAMSRLRQSGISMPIAVKDNFLYFKPVQGDINFIVPCAFVRRHNLAPIRSWKSGRNTPEALQYMWKQEQRPGFMAWARDIAGLA